MSGRGGLISRLYPVSDFTVVGVEGRVFDFPFFVFWFGDMIPDWIPAEYLITSGKASETIDELTR
jgi:hypothetical protein